MATEIPGNIEQIPTNPDEIFKLLGAIPEDEEIQEGETGEPEPKAAEGQGEPQKQDDQTPAGEKPDDKAEPEKGEDKMVPLTAVFAEREKARAYREKAAAMQARIEELEKAQAAGTKAPDATGEATSFTAEQLAEIEEAFPAIGAGLRAMQGRMDRMEHENRELKADKVGRERVAEEDARQSAQQEVAQAISAVPKLDHLNKTLKDDVWDARVASIDDQLRQDPEFSKLSNVDRFKKVVEVYEFRYGPVAIPQEPKQDKSQQERAAEVLKQAGDPEPSTLSDLPGGIVPDSPGRDIERLSVHDIANMDPQALDRLISRMA